MGISQAAMIDMMGTVYLTKMLSSIASVAPIIRSSSQL